MRILNDVLDSFYSEDNAQDQSRQGFGDIQIQNYLSDHSINSEIINSIDDLDQKIIQNENVLRLKRQIVRIQPQRRKPGETKNIPKNIARVMKKYIQNIIQNSLDGALRSYQNNKAWIRFKSIPHDNVMKKQIEQFLQTKLGQLCGKQFFGNCLWAYYFVSENKTNVSLYYKHNQTYFMKTLEQKQNTIKK
ncbi:unnamed protein product [Paramecium sonneborni]|uniref:Uncharacterized protein n=1 Tax=Paramecium sonneborni TaxID=65129 RepID=A0A8S1NZG9_9CILI|nr:unnamed protein product [Paramecium sonneborni]